MAVAVLLAGGAGAAGTPILTTLLPACVLTVGIGLVQCLSPWAALQPASWWPGTVSVYETLHHALLWASYAAVIWATAVVSARKGATRRLAWSIVLLGWLVTLVGLAQRSAGNTAYYGLRVIRHGDPFGPYTNHNHAAAFLAMTGLTGCGLFLQLISSLRRTTGVGKSADIVAKGTIALCLALLSVYAAAATHSRGGVDSLVVAFIVVAVFSLRLFDSPWKRVAGLAPILCAVTAFALILYRHPILYGNLAAHPDQSTAFRLHMYRDGMKMLLDYPLFGVGLGAFAKIYPAYESRLIPGFADHVHSDWLELVLQVGVVGALPLVSSLAYVGIRMGKSWISGNREARLAILGMTASIIAFLSASLVDFPFQMPGNAVCFFVILTLACSMCFKHRALHSKRRPLPSLAMLAIAAASLCPTVAATYRYFGSCAPEVSRPYYFARSLAWDRDPDDAYGLAWTYVSLAKGNPSAAQILYSKAFKISNHLVEVDPLNPDFQNLHAWIVQAAPRRAMR